MERGFFDPIFLTNPLMWLAKDYSQREGDIEQG